MGLRFIGCVTAALFACTSVAALELAIPQGGQITLQHRQEGQTYFAPVAPFDGNSIPTEELTGTLSEQVWTFPSQALTTFQLLDPIRKQLEVEGFEFVLSCQAAECGGFDFRFGTRVASAPHMFVDILDYRFLTARKGGADGQYITVLASRSGSTGYLQILELSPRGQSVITTASTVEVTPPPAITVEASEFVKVLEGQGYLVMSDLEFQTGSSKLGQGEFTSLKQLAEFLKADANRRVALVGHTDTVGALANNIALSKARAASVLERLAIDYKVPRGQMEAEGMGYLSPVTSNLTAEGRESNRRVEVVLLNTE